MNYIPLKLLLFSGFVLLLTLITPDSNTPEEEVKTSLLEKNCTNEHHMCSEWSLIGECESNPNFMLTKCKESCRICQSKRCHDKNSHVHPHGVPVFIQLSFICQI